MSKLLVNNPGSSCQENNYHLEYKNATDIFDCLVSSDTF